MLQAPAAQLVEFYSAAVAGYYSAVDTPLGFDHRLAELLPQSADTDLDGVAFDLAAEGAATVFELVLGQDGVRMLQQGLEKRPFPGTDTTTRPR